MPGADSLKTIGLLLGLAGLSLFAFQWLVWSWKPTRDRRIALRNGNLRTRMPVRRPRSEDERHDYSPVRGSGWRPALSLLSCLCFLAMAPLIAESIPFTIGAGGAAAVMTYFLLSIARMQFSTQNRLVVTRFGIQGPARAGRNRFVEWRNVSVPSVDEDSKFGARLSILESPEAVEPGMTYSKGYQSLEFDLDLNHLSAPIDEVFATIAGSWLEYSGCPLGELDHLVIRTPLGMHAFPALGVDKLRGTVLGEVGDPRDSDPLA